MNATLFARMSLKSGIPVEDRQFAFVGSDFDVVDGNDSDDGEESTLGLPTLRTTASMVVENVAFDGDFHFVFGTMAVQLATSEVVASLGEAIVDQWMDRKDHGSGFDCFLVDMECYEDVSNREIGYKGANGLILTLI